MSTLLCFAGEIGSGKSSVSTAVAEALGWGRTGFGDYLRGEVLRVGGDADSREALQKLGQERVATDPAAFCRDVLFAGGYASGADFVVDGVRHVNIFAVLRSLATPADTRLIFLDAAKTTRAQRVQGRPDQQDFERASKHAVEAELSDALPAAADARINAEQELGLIVEECLQFIRQWQAAASPRGQ